MSSQERRKVARADLHWPVRIFRHDREAPLETKTQNISSGGLYSVVEECIPIGEIVDCLLFIPGGHAKGVSAGLWLRCSARVVHVTALKHGVFGVGMSLVEYSVIPKLEQALTTQIG
jgi:hypothetical protein